MLQGGKGGSSVSVKWDGAPAVFCGINPENGKFFVGTKSIFNATPKINYTNADIKRPSLRIPRTNANIIGLWTETHIFTTKESADRAQIWTRGKGQRPETKREPWAAALTRKNRYFGTPNYHCSTRITTTAAKQRSWRQDTQISLGAGTPRTLYRAEYVLALEYRILTHETEPVCLYGKDGTSEYSPNVLEYLKSTVRKVQLYLCTKYRYYALASTCEVQYLYY